MRESIVQVVGDAPIQFSKSVSLTKKEREGHDDYEARTWWDRAHRTEENQLFIPGAAFYHSLCGGAKYLGTIPGRGKETFTKYFERGLLVRRPCMIDAFIIPGATDDIPPALVKVERLALHVPSDGKAGGGKRVWKCFPVVKKWTCEVEIEILDDIITEQLLAAAFDFAGKYIGVGSFRPEKRGYFGRYHAQEGITVNLT